jgi:hypothetical protein
MRLHRTRKSVRAHMCTCRRRPRILYRKGRWGSRRI